MKKAIIIVCTFLVALSIVTASGQGTVSIAGSGFASVAAPLPRVQGFSAAISTTAQATAAKKPTQVQNSDLQNTLEKQQQTLQMLSNILKSKSDTAISVIRKMRG